MRRVPNARPVLTYLCPEYQQRILLVRNTYRSIIIFPASLLLLFKEEYLTAARIPVTIAPRKAKEQSPPMLRAVERDLGISATRSVEFITWRIGCEARISWNCACVLEAFLAPEHTGA